jgi:pimeloyl-ACP methyl ester carboxylesterase
MKRALTRFSGLALLSLFLVLTLSSFTAHADDVSPENVVSRTAEVDGVQVHYWTAGHGAPLILLHGYAETSLMWKPIIPQLATRFMVIAPDLPGIGDSSIPATGLDMKTSAIRMHALAVSLGVKKPRWSAMISA